MSWPDLEKQARVMERLERLYAIQRRRRLSEIWRAILGAAPRPSVSSPRRATGIGEARREADLKAG
jgi:hypothetical protein